jgi:hypothetical protein
MNSGATLPTGIVIFAVGGAVQAASHRLDASNSQSDLFANAGALIA